MAAIKFFYGLEPYAFKKAIENFGESTDILKKKVWDGECESFACSYSFLQSDKVLILDLEELRADENMLSFLSDTEALTCDVYIYARKVSTNTKIFKYLSSCDTVKCDKFKGKELQQLVLEECAKINAKISKEAFDLLISRINYYGKDEVTFDTIVKRIHQCAAAENITPSVVTTFVADDSDFNIWSLTSLLDKGDIEAFMEGCNKLLPITDAIGILSALLRAYRISWKASLLEGSNEQKSKVLGLYNSNILPLSTGKAADIIHTINAAILDCKRSLNQKLILMQTGINIVNIMNR